MGARVDPPRGTRLSPPALARLTVAAKLTAREREALSFAHGAMLTLAADDALPAEARRLFGDNGQVIADLLDKDRFQ